MALANLVVAPVALVMIGARPAMPSRDSLRQIWAFARSSIPGGIVGTAQQRMDIILLGFFVGTGVAGIYEIAFKLTIPAMFVAGVAQSGLMGRVSNLRSRGEPFAADVENNLAFASILGFPLFFGALALAEPIVVTVYSSQYAAAAPYLVGLALFRLLRSQKVILVSTINGLDRPDLNLKISTGVFTVNLALGVGLLVTVGPLGVVIATVISELFGYGLRAYAVGSLVPDVSLLPSPIYAQFASGVVMAVVLVAGRVALPLGAWPTVLALIGLGGVTYFVTLLGLSEPLRATLRAVATDAGLR
jgi:O-antigen/teichoic acid export membrane protein